MGFLVADDSSALVAAVKEQAGRRCRRPGTRPRRHRACRCEGRRRACCRKGSLAGLREGSPAPCARQPPPRSPAAARSPLRYAQDAPRYAQAVLCVLAGGAAAACACSLCWPRWPAAARSLAGRQCARSPLRYAQAAQDAPRYGPGVLRVLARGAAAARACSLC